MPARDRARRPPAGRGHHTVAGGAVRLLLGWGAVVAAVLGVGLLLTGPLHGSVGVADNDLEGWFAAHRSAALTRTAEGVSLLGDTRTELVLGPALVLGSWVWTRRVPPAAFLAVGLVGEVAAYLVTVNVVDRHRPPVPLLDAGLDPTHSYPSGHVAAATAMYGGVALLIWLSGAGRRRGLGVPLIVLPPLVAVARLYQGAHHLSDVVASLLFVTLWLVISAGVVLVSGSRTKVME